MALPDLSDRFCGALLGTMLGDAVGAPWEGTDAERIAAFCTAYPTLTFADQQMNRALFGLLLSDSVIDARYTDDTQMTLALAETIISHSEAVLAPGDTRFEAALAAQFADVFDPARGYGPGAYGVLLALRRGAAWDDPARQLFGGRGSYGNGAAMRVAPIGLFFHDAGASALREAARRSALPTHTNALGIAGAVMQAAAVARACRHTTETFDALGFLADVENALGNDEAMALYHDACAKVRELLPLARTPEVVNSILGSDITAPASVPAALYAFLAHHDDFRAAVTFAVQMGNDTDTVAAMCGAISGAYLGATVLPLAWLQAMENGVQGRDYAHALADRLCAAWQAHNANRF